MLLGAPFIRSPGAALLRAGALALALAAATVVSGCGDVNGGDVPFAGTSNYQDPGGAYQLRLLEPPWIPLPLPTGTIFVVPPTDTITLSAASQESDALYSLHVNGVAGDAAGALAAAASGNPAWDLSKQRPVHAVSGAAGVELSWKEGPQTFHREAFLAGPGGPTFQMHFTAKKDIGDDGMIAQMVLSFAPRGTTAVGAPR